MPAEVKYASVRDASWWTNPNTSHPKKWHVWKAGFASCGLNIMLVEEWKTPVVNVPEHCRCKKCNWKETDNGSS